MPMFKQNIIAIEAFQVPPEGETISDEMHEFLSVSNLDLDNLGDGSIEIFDGSSGHEDLARPGDWIYKERGFYKVMGKEYFKTNYSLHVRSENDEIKK